MKHALIFAVLLSAAALQAQQPSTPAGDTVRVGPRPDGSFLLNSGWRIKPAGKQIALDTLPMASLPTPDGRSLLVLNGGYNPPSISVIDVASEAETSRTPVPDAWLGMALSRSGDKLWVGGGSKASIYEFSVSGGTLKAERTYVVTEAPAFQDFIGDVALSPDGRSLFACDVFRNRIDVIDVESGKVVHKFATGRRPYRIMFAPDGKTFLVTSWADGTLYQHDTATGYRMNALRLGSHPTDMVWSTRKPEQASAEEREAYDARLFVAAANTNNVYVVGLKGSSLSAIETINVADSPRHPLGMTPSGLALNAAQTRLYVACSDANAVAVVNVEDAQSVVTGFLPTGWYPTAVRVLKDERLVVLNGKGARSYANPAGPSPVRRAAPYEAGTNGAQYVGRMQTGSASVIAPFDSAKLREYTREVLAESPYDDNMLDRLEVPAGNPVPGNVGGRSPIQHVIYILKENRTYDQVLGDIGKGESDASLALFTDKVGPNHHKLAREFVLFDNFYVNADVSADGHNWSDAAIAPDYVEKMWPSTYAKRRNHYDFEGGEPAGLPAAGYLWTNALAADIPIRNYGHFVTNAGRGQQDGVQVAAVKDPALEAVTNKLYRGFDLDYPDVERVKVFLNELKSFEASNNMPKLIMLRLGNDHTYGASPGKLSPLSLFADNDYALGLLVEAVSHSKFWGSTAVFVLEDDAQNGPDHIDSHRSPVFVLSPYTRRGTVDSTMYNTTSVLRTIELLVGLHPMTHFDAGATPMWRAFAATPVMTPYDAVKPGVALDERNPEKTGAASRRRANDFSEADLNDDDEMNAEIWRAVKGTEPPPPVRSYFGGR